MTKVNFASNREQAEREGLLGSGSYLKLQEGDNRIRLMSECLPHAGEFKGTKTFKWLCYVIDRKDGKLKPYFMAHTIYKQIEALQLKSGLRLRRSSDAVRHHHQRQRRRDKGSRLHADAGEGQFTPLTR